MDSVRINKYLADKGLATRKEADELIERSLVFVNGKRAILGQKVLGSDRVEVRGKQKHYHYFAFNKPEGVITHSPQLGERDALNASGLKGVFPVGRLDKASSGLLILTDDARITDRLLNPKYPHEKEYRVSTKEKLPRDFKERMERGVNIEGYVTKQCKVRITGEKSFIIILSEGKKHQIRRMCSAQGLVVERLQRTRILNIKLAGLERGGYRTVGDEELKEFLRTLGLSA